MLLGAVEINRAVLRAYQRFLQLVLSTQNLVIEGNQRKENGKGGDGNVHECDCLGGSKRISKMQEKSAAIAIITIQ